MLFNPNLTSNSPSPSSTSASRKRKRRRARSSSVITSASIDPFRPDDELETAKAAAMKLLENSCDQSSIDFAEQSFKFETQNQSIGSDSPIPPRPKKTRFEEITTIIEEAEVPFDSTNLKTPSTIQLAYPQSSVQVPSSDPSAEQDKHKSPTIPQPCPIIQTSQSDFNFISDQIQAEETFQVSRDEIFSNDAIVNAFKAAMLEFQFCRIKRAECQKLENPLRLPNSRVEKRHSSALYYGKPPPRPPTRAKKPPIQSIFSSPPPGSPSPLKETRVLAAAPAVIPQTSPVCSELDMDEYMEMFGGSAPPEPRQINEPAVAPATQASPACSKLVMEKYMDMFEGRASPGPTLVLNAPNMIGDKSTGPMVEEDRSTDMSCDSSSSSKHPSHSPSTPTAPTSLNSPAPCPHASGVAAPLLSATQRRLLTNALQAQYWAGYHTALFNRSIGIETVETTNSCMRPTGAVVDQTSGWETGQEASGLTRLPIP